MRSTWCATRTGPVTCKSFIVRTPHLFGAGAVQRLAEEMTGELQAQRQRAKEAACAMGRAQSAPLQAKGVEFGTIAAMPVARAPCEVDFDTSGVEGVDADLVIRPFRWKGADLNLRAFVREAANNEIGMQAVELVGPDVDGDHDGVVDELTVGDITALELYVAAQPRPVSTLELAELGLIEPLSAGERGAIRRGEALFSSMGCAECHRPTLTVDEPTFSTPSQSPSYREAMFPGGLDPVAEGLDPATPVSYDLTRELPDNVVVTPSGETFELGVFTTNDHGGAMIPLYSDLKRHDMGPELADSVDEIGTGPSVWLSPELWGVGSTAPYLHDGRATTLDEAIRAHGGEANASRVAYESSSEANRAQLIAFLESLMLFRLPEDEVD
jgi:Di-haem oxidoreductase, putative peroxidase